MIDLRLLEFHIERIKVGGQTMMSKNVCGLGDYIQSHDMPQLLHMIDLLKTAYSVEVKSIDIMPGGLTNKNLKIITDNDDAYAVRLAGQGTHSFINRQAEKHNAALMASLGIAPEIYYYDQISGSQLCKYINAETMHPEDFNSNPDVIIKTAEIMSKYHNSGMEFMSKFDSIDKIHDYNEILIEKNFDKRYQMWDRILQMIEEIRKAYERRPVELVPCHNDTLAENFLYDGKIMHIVDWEYSGMGDKFFDISCVFVENRLSKAHEKMYLKQYFGAEPSIEDCARVLINKFLVNAHWSIWALVQIASGKDYDFYWAYGKKRAVECNEIIIDPDFDCYLKLIG